MLPLHFGSLHAVEMALVALLAFGPFVVLVVVVLLIRRRDEAEEQDEGSTADAAEPSDSG